jgi:hypothetical protein
LSFMARPPRGALATGAEDVLAFPLSRAVQSTQQQAGGRVPLVRSLPPRLSSSPSDRISGGCGVARRDGLARCRGLFRALARSAGLSLAGRGRAHRALAVGLHRREIDFSNSAIFIGSVDAFPDFLKDGPWRFAPECANLVDREIGRREARRQIDEPGLGPEALGGIGHEATFLRSNFDREDASPMSFSGPPRVCGARALKRS